MYTGKKVVVTVAPSPGELGNKKKKKGEFNTFVIVRRKCQYFAETHKTYNIFFKVTPPMFTYGERVITFVMYNSGSLFFFYIVLFHLYCLSVSL